MKRSSLSLFTAVMLAFGFTLNAQPITQSDLDSALANAKTEWGSTPDYPVKIRAEKASACGVVQSEARDTLPHPTDVQDLAGGVAISNLMQYTERWIPDPDEDVTSTFTPEGGTSEAFNAKTTSEAMAPEKPTYEWIIRINASCTFLTPELLRKFVLHEYGHTLGLAHSKNDRSIMYWVVFLPPAEKKFGAQSITPADRAAIPTERSSK